MVNMQLPTGTEVRQSDPRGVQLAVMYEWLIGSVKQGGGMQGYTREASEVRTRHTLARPTSSFFAMAVAPRPSLRSRRTSSGLMLGLRPL